jgi:AcrR family transcriptional regulator
LARPKGARDADYDEKRTTLLERMIPRVMRREVTRPSLRQLAEAAEVTVPTLRHYFGSRAEVISAVMEAYLGQGTARLRALSEPDGDLDQSVRSFAHGLLAAVQAPRQVLLGDVFAVSLAEGLLDRNIGPSALAFIIDPSVDTLSRRLDAHISRGEMRNCDTRAASLMLLAPLLLATLHQNQMGGRTCNPLDLTAAADELCNAFVRAYRLED